MSVYIVCAPIINPTHFKFEIIIIIKMRLIHYVNITLDVQISDNQL